MLYENTVGKVYVENNMIYVSTAVGRTIIEVYDESDFDYINQVFESYVQKLKYLERYYVIVDKY